LNKAYGQESRIIEIAVPKNVNLQIEVFQMDGRTAIFIRLNQLPTLNQFGTLRPLD